MFMVDFLVEHKYFNISGKHCNALIVVVVVFGAQATNKPSLVRVPVDYSLKTS